MAGTQAPKGFGLLFAIVGIPLIVWDAAGTSNELEALDASSSSENARIKACVTKTAKFGRDVSTHRQICGCIVKKAAERRAFKDYGAYDEALLEPIISECIRGS